MAAAAVVLAMHAPSARAWTLTGTDFPENWIIGVAGGDVYHCNVATGVMTRLEIGPALTGNALIDLRGGDDNLRIAAANRVWNGCGTTLFGVDYNGKTITTYGGCGNDRIFGGEGRDVTYGDSETDPVVCDDTHRWRATTTI